MKSLLLMFFLTLYGKAFTQSSFSIGPHISAGQKAFKYHEAGAGVSLEGVKAISSKSGIRVYTGYTSFYQNKSWNGVHYIPIRLGYQHFFPKGLSAFGDLGIGSFYYPTFKYMRFSFGSGGTYRLPVSKQTFLQFSLIYNYTRDNGNGYYGWVDVRAAYGLNSKK